MTTRCGTIAIVGKPNVGKSTLLNALVGEKLAIVSRKPQATREPVIGVRTEPETQLVLVDLPGLLDPEYLMHEAMREAAVFWVKKADAVLHLHHASRKPLPSLPSLAPEIGPTGPVATVITKIDLKKPSPVIRADSDDPVFEVSVRSGSGIEALLAWCRVHAPPGPFRYEADEVSTQPMRFFVTEFVREAAFDLLGDELPYSLVAEVDEYRESSKPLYIRVTVFVERETQKRMVIGKGGRTIKALGRQAREKIETLVGEQVYLDLWIKTLPKWRSDPAQLARFGLVTSHRRNT